MQEFDDTLLEPFALDDFHVPLIRLTSGGPPLTDILVGDKTFHYDRSYPIKGHSAVMPGYVRDLLAQGKAPMVIERSDRFYLYVA